VASQVVPVLQNNCDRLKGCDLRDNRARTVVLCVAHVADIAQIRFRVRQISNIEGQLRVVNLVWSPLAECLEAGGCEGVEDSDHYRLRPYALETHGPELEPDEDNPGLSSGERYAGTPTPGVTAIGTFGARGIVNEPSISLVFAE
jgi:hypothetical protein